MRKSLFIKTVETANTADLCNAPRPLWVRFLLKTIYRQAWFYYWRAEGIGSVPDKIRRLQEQVTIRDRKLDTLYAICAELEGSTDSLTLQRLIECDCG